MVPGVTDDDRVTTIDRNWFVNTLIMMVVNVEGINEFSFEGKADLEFAILGDATRSIDSTDFNAGKINVHIKSFWHMWMCLN